MVIRTKKNVPLYEKFELFTEAPKRRKKRVINVRTSRARDYTAYVDPEEIEINNTPPEEDEMLPGDTGDADYSNDTTGGENGGSNDTGNQPDGGENDEQPQGGDVQQTSDEPESDAGGAATANTPDGESGSTAQSGSDNTGNGEESDPGTTGGDGTSSVQTTEPSTSELPAANGDTSGGDGTGTAASGNAPDQTPTGDADTSGENGDPGTSDTTGENQTNPDGEGNVTPDQQAATGQEEDTSGEVIEIEDPSAADNDFTTGVDDAGGDGTEGNAAPDAATTTDPNADPNAAADPNASVDADVSSDMESFDKDDMRKYQLFKRFIDLHDVTIHFISTLEAIISDDANFGAIITTTTKKLKKIEEILKDYMVLKFQSDSYLQNSFFFEKAKTSILIALEMLKQGKKQDNVSKH